MGQECSGCKWIADEIDRRNSVLTQFQDLGDTRFAQIAQEGIEALSQDWRAHVARDHATEMESMVMLCNAVNEPPGLAGFNVPDEYTHPACRKSATPA